MLQLLAERLQTELRTVPGDVTTGLPYSEIQVIYQAPGDDIAAFVTVVAEGGTPENSPTSLRGAVDETSVNITAWAESAEVAWRLIRQVRYFQQVRGSIGYTSGPDIGQSIISCIAAEGPTPIEQNQRYGYGYVYTIEWSDDSAFWRAREAL